MLRPAPLRFLAVASIVGCLNLPAWSQQPLLGGEPATLVVDLLDPAHPARTALGLDPDRPPLLLEGLQPATMEELRRWLWAWARPDLFPDPALPEVAHGLRPSRRKLLLRCDPGQAFGWVQQVMQCCSLRPGQDLSAELRTSPLLRHLELELAGTGKRVDVSLPVDLGLQGGPRPRVVTVTLGVRESGRRDPPGEQTVVFGAAGGGHLFGSCRGLASHSSQAVDVSLLLEPPTTLLDLRHYLKSRRGTSGVMGRMGVDPSVPVACAFEALRAFREEDYRQVGIGLSARVPVEEAADEEMEEEEITEEEVEEAPAGRAVEAEMEENGVDEEPPLGGTPGDEHDGTVRDQARVAALEQALDWIVRHQSQDGSWDCDGASWPCVSTPGTGCRGPGSLAHDIGVSGLALLALMGAGNTPSFGPHQDAVAAGLRWLQKQQDPEGCFGPRGDPHHSYNHAIAALAMAEACGLTGSPAWREPAQEGINWVLRMQNPYKAWRYGERPGDNDMSVTAWMVMALKSAKLAKLEVPDRAMQWAHGFVEEMTDPETGRTGYTRPGERPVRSEGQRQRFPPEYSESLTAAGMMVRIFCGEDVRTSPQLKAGAELCAKRLPRWEPEQGKVDMCYWYFGTMAMFQIGGSAWSEWHQALLPALLPSQLKESCGRGSWDPVGPWGGMGGRVYSTALMTLCLEICHRTVRGAGEPR